MMYHNAQKQNPFDYKHDSLLEFRYNKGKYNKGFDWGVNESSAVKQV